MNHIDLASKFFETARNNPIMNMECGAAKDFVRDSVFPA